MPSMPPVEYPKVKRDESFIETLHGCPIKDPYRWLEDPKSEETKTFVAAQNDLFNKYISQYADKSKIASKLTEAYDYEKYGCPFKRGQYYYFFHNSGLQPQSILYRIPAVDGDAAVNKDANQPHGAVDKAEKFFDPNEFAADGTASLSSMAFSESGNLFAYGLSFSGSDWVTIKVMDATTKVTHQQQQDVIEWVKFSSISWTHDERSFYYLQYPKPTVDDAGTETDMNTCPKLYRHVIGTCQDADELVFEDSSNPTHMFGTRVSDDGRYLIMTISNSCDPVNKLYIMDLTAAKKEFIKVVDNFDAEYSYITNEGTKFYFKSNINAPRYKVVTVDIQSTTVVFKDLIPQEPTTHVLQDVSCIYEKFLVTVYMEDCKNTVSIRHLDTGKLYKNLPVEIASIDAMTGRKEDSVMFLKLSSFLNPGIIYKYDFKTEALGVYYRTAVRVKGFNLDDYTQTQEFFVSTDGTKVPMFIIGPKASLKKKHLPVYLYGYGGFNISLTPMFSPQWLVFMVALNGMVAIPNIRGGGEYGDEWHKAGCLHNKQQGFDDFASAAKHLVQSGYTEHRMITINGGSNGGLLVAASTNQKPEYFGCAIAEVGVLDMLRFHKFTIGHAWRSDYGDPDKKEDFDVLIKYSPFHTVSAEKVYPSMLLMTSDHDDRVVPLHSFKYIAALQHARPMNPNPLLIRIDTKAGHGAGKPTAKRVEEAADRLSFIALSLGIQVAKI